MLSMLLRFSEGNMNIWTKFEPIMQLSSIFSWHLPCVVNIFQTPCVQFVIQAFSYKFVVSEPKLRFTPMTSRQYDIIDVILSDLTAVKISFQRPSITNHDMYWLWNWRRVYLNISVPVQSHRCSGEPVLVLLPSVGGSSQLPWEVGMWETGEWGRGWLFHLVHHCHWLCPALCHGGLALQHKDELSAPKKQTTSVAKSEQNVASPPSPVPWRPRKPDVSGSSSKNKCERWRQRRGITRRFTPPTGFQARRYSLIDKTKRLCGS